MASVLGISINFFDATLGSTLDPETIEHVYDRDENIRKFKRPLSRQEVGCYLSHKRLWGQIASGDESAAIVLEDDALIEGDLVGLVKDLSAIDIEKVYVKLDGPCGSSSEGNTLQFGDHKLEQARWIAPRTTGYIIGRVAARTLSEYRDRFFRPVDIDLKHHWEHGIPILTTSPQLVREIHPDGSGSAIESSREELKPQKSTVRFWKNLSYQTRYKWACYTHPVTTIAPLPREKHPDYA